jgi:non-specific serine/threonine protein kinase
MQQLIVEPLSKRELEVLRQIADGLSNREIAEKLFISLETVKWYNKQIYSKMGAKNRTQAVALAREEGLFETAPAAAPSLDLAPRHNLPAEVTSFIGREREIAQAREMLEKTRLLTLTGPGGTGKTRLSLQVATAALDSFEDGVTFVDLAPVSDPATVAEVIARALGLAGSPDELAIVTLQKFLGNREHLLVLDNFEHILEAAPLISDLLAAGPRLKALVTSREVLRLSGEKEFSVPPLTLPDRAQVGGASALTEYEAVALFVERAIDAQPDFALTDQNAAVVADICMQLDGLPLAIELAAARSRLLSPDMMLDRLCSRLGVLTGGPRDAPARLQTLRGTIDWSYDLLDSGERALFARLAVFQGGRTIEAVEAVCSHDPGIELLDGLESLLNKSLLQVEDGPEGEPRFVMLETIHEYARERLEQSGEADELRKRHAAYFAELAERAAKELRGARQQYWFRRLEAERENLGRALARTVGTEAGIEATLGLRMVGALRDFWFYTGYFAEGSKWTGLALERLADATPELRARVLNSAGMMAATAEEHERGKALNREAAAIYRELGDKRNMAWSLSILSANLSETPDEFEAGIAMGEEALALFTETGDKQGEAYALNVLGEFARLSGDYEGARDWYERTLAVSRETGETRRVALMVTNMGFIAQNSGDFERAEGLFTETLIRCLELSWRWGFADALTALAGAVNGLGQSERAAKLIGASDGLLEAMGAAHQPSDREQYQRNADDVRAALGDRAYQAAWTEGHAMTFKQAVDYALGRRAE